MKPETLKDLLARREHVRQRHALLDEVAPRPAGEPPLGGRPVAFVDGEEAHFVGGCVADVYAALAKFLDAHPKPDMDTEPQERRGWYTANKLLDSRNGDETLTVPRGLWNDCLWALREAGVWVSSTGMK